MTRPASVTRVVFLIAAVILAAIVVVAAIAIVVSRRSRVSAPDGVPEIAAPAAEPTPDTRPMTGLESALEQVTDRQGRPIREAIDAEAGHVDDLRVPDDTGPLLRRALDHVAPPSDDVSEAAPDDDAATS